jgi:hypothetical protein
MAGVVDMYEYRMRGTISVHCKENPIYVFRELGDRTL